MTTLLADREIERLMALHPKGFDLSLDRITRLLERLGNPQLRLPPVIHIAGTNGKGSAAAFCARAAGGRRLRASTSTPRRIWSTGTSATGMAAPGGGRLVDDALLAEAIARVARGQCAARRSPSSRS